MGLDRYLGSYITSAPTLPTQSSAQGVWELEQQASAQVQNAWPLPPNVIQRSLRFNSADATGLNWTPSSAGNQYTFTTSMWVKRSSLGSTQFVAAYYDYCHFGFESDDTMYGNLRGTGGTNYFWISSAKFRDPSAWYHLVFVVDTANATSTNRFKFYVNGVEQTFSTISYPTQNLAQVTASIRYLGRYSSPAYHFNGYMAEVNFIDGQALTPSSFGETDAQTGVWVPKRYTGTYGTNGFRLPFTNNSTTTALGFDASGNGNNWTPNNFSVTAGSGNDSLLDVPSLYGTDTGLGGEVRGNYCTWNPLQQSVLGGTQTLSNGNLDTQTSLGGVNATFFVSSGKWYWEATLTSATSFALTGIGQGNSTNYPGFSSTSYAYIYNGNKINNDTQVAYGATYTTGDVIGIALDLDSSTTTLTFYKNGVSQGVAYSGISGLFTPRIGNGTSGSQASWSTNFGQRPFAYTAPTGFKALCTTNLSAPAIGQTSTNQADNYFNTVLYNGTGATQSITGVGFQPDFLWIKGRSVDNHNLHNSIVGAATWLSSDTTGAEQTNSAVLTSFDADGFTVGSNPSSNASGVSFVAWSWNAGGSTVSNTQGTITSTVRANPASGFSVVRFTGSATNNTVGHGLGAAPAFIIVKAASESGQSWRCYHQSLGIDSYITLDSTAGAGTTSGYWGSSAFTTSIFGVYAGGGAGNNRTGQTMIAYCFAAIPGFSAFGSYTGNGSADGPFVYTGFRPRWVLIKIATGSPAADWVLHDTSRSPYNVSDTKLSPNTSAADVTTSAVNIDILSSGFKIRNTDGAYNTSSNTYIYAAFAEYPFRLSLAR